jgi:hypothetical protein
VSHTFHERALAAMHRLNQQPAAGQKQLEMGRLAIHPPHQKLSDCGLARQFKTKRLRRLVAVF